MARAVQHEEFDLDLGSPSDLRPVVELGSPPARDATPSSAPAVVGRRPDRMIGWLLSSLALVAAGVLAAPSHEEPAPSWGLLTSLEDPPAPLWSTPVPSRTPTQQRYLVTDLTLLADRVVLHDGRTLRGFDVRDGREVWEVAGESSWCIQELDPIVCVQGEGRTAEVLRIDARTGRVDRLAAPEAIAAATYGGDLLLLRGDPDGQRVIRFAGWNAAGTERWRRVVGPYRDPPVHQFSDALRPAGETLVVTGEWNAVLDLDTGEPLVARPEVVSVDGTLTVVDRERGEMVVHPPDGADPLRYAADSALLQVDDDAASEVLLTGAYPRVVALSRASGDELWRSGSAWPVARLAGTVVSWTGVGMVGTDLATGEATWTSAKWTSDLWCLCYGSGTTLLAFEWLTSPAFVGVDVRTGEVTWRSPAPGGPIATAARGDHLAFLSDGALTLLDTS